MTKTKVEAVALCPGEGCEQELPQPLPEKCPACGIIVSKPDNEFFEYTDFWCLQLEEHEKNITDLKLPGEEEEAQKRKLKDEYVKWIRSIPAQEKTCAMLDAYEVMRHLMFSKEDITHLKPIIELGKIIGKQAEAIDAYYKSGGQPYEYKARPVPTEPLDIPRD